MHNLSFPPTFVWGAATSSYQIEGAALLDGRGESIWDRFSHTAGRIDDDSSGDVACDHYHRWRDDVALMQALGMQAYRFSIAWPRILPNGRGAVNEAGLQFYSDLVDELLKHGITPYATLYHWDLPQVLQDEGGWTVRSTAEAFVEYAEVVAQRLGDRVKHWITHNEPWCASFLSYQIGEHAPGLQDWSAAIAASHHLLLSHGLSVPVIRRHSPGAQVGITLNLVPVMAASASDADQAVAHFADGYHNRWFLDPLYKREYPQDMVDTFVERGDLPAEGMPWVARGDLEAIAAPTDFLGVNYYTRKLVRDTTSAANLPPEHHLAPPDQHTDIGWEVYPSGMCDLLVRLHRDYHPPALYITENGASYNEGPNGDGQIHDQRRTHYLYDHLAACHQALKAGVPLCGYFVWSLMDNFEWARGYTQRFGVVWVDFATQQRTPKDSAKWYSRVITANAVVPVN